MSVEVTEPRTLPSSIERRSSTSRRLRKLWGRVWKARMLYLMLLPSIVWFLIFRYYPYYGLTLAFKDFSAGLTIASSPWIGLEHFQTLFSRPAFTRVLWNTIILSAMKLVFGMPVPIIFALLLNEVRLLFFKRSIQTVTYFPHFLSWVIYGGIMILFLQPGGAISELVTNLGFNGRTILVNTRYFRWILVVTSVMKEFGWNAILYLAALTSISPALYEAARMDGANRWHQMRYITIPGIMGVIVIVFILNLGHILEAGFEQVFVMYNPSVYSVADILDTYIYRIGLVDGRFSLATAVGLFKGIIGLVFIVSANEILKRTDRPTIW